MKKIKAFIYVFYKSISSFEYYKDIFNTPFSFSIKYLAMLALFATLITATVTGIRDTPQVTTWIENQKAQLVDMYPDDLEFKIENGEWNINQPEPYYIKTPSDIELPDQELPENFVVLYKEGTINDFESLNTFVLINENNALVQAEDKLEVYPLKEIPDGTLNKQVFLTLLDKTNEVTKYVPYLFITVVIFGLYFYFFVLRLVYLLLVTLFLWMVNMFIKPSIEFTNLYRIALHAMTVPFIIDVVLKLFNVTIVEVPWFLLLNILLGTLVIAKATKINE